MKRFDFYHLPRGLQDRFIESTQGVAVPLAIAARPFGSMKPRLWTIAALVFLGLLIVTALHGFGDLDSAAALGGPREFALYVGLAFGALFSAACAYWSSSALSALPYANADYLFPSGILKVSGPSLYSHDGADIELRPVTGPELVAKVRGGPTFQFSFDSAESAASAAAAFEDGKRRWTDSKNGDPLERARLSCLVESGIPNPLAPTRPHPRPARLPEVLSYISALLLAALVGSGLALFRNELSEKAMYQVATAKNTVDAYEKYVARGGRRRDVREILLPRARLAEAVSSKAPGPVLEFAKTPDAAKIQPEVDAAVRAALLEELSLAQKEGTLTALAELAAKYPQRTLIEPELSQARHAIYQSAYQSFLSKAVDDPSLTEFVGHLLAYAERHGPRVLLRFSHEFPQDVEIVDNIVKKSEKYYLGSKSLPSPHFLGAEARRREQALGEKLIVALNAAFPRDVLYFELAPLPEQANLPQPEPSEPTLTVTHKETLSGGFVGGAPKNMYLGATVRVTAKFTLPGDRPQHEFVFAVWRNPSLSITEQRPTDIDAVYDDMMTGAFEDFRKIYLKKWFKP
jgi:hypothetical protein